MNIRSGVMVLVLFLGAAFLGACGDDEVLDPPIKRLTVCPPNTETALMQDFRTAYEDMDYQVLECLMHPDFETFLQPVTTAQFPDLGPTLDFEEEVRIAQRMFSGQPVTDPDGQLIPAISSINFQILEQQGAWLDTGPAGIIPHARTAIFETLMVFERPGATSLPVEGQIRFFVSRHDTVLNGEPQSLYFMIGQQDLTRIDKKAVERIPWGSLKALYR